MQLFIRTTFHLAVLCAGLLTNAAQAQEEPPKQLDGGTTVATFTYLNQPRTVTYKDITHERMFNARLMTAETSDSAKRETLHTLAELAAYRTMLYADGLAQGMQDDPQIKAAVEPELISYLVNKLRYETEKTVAEPTDADIEAIYADQKDQMIEKEKYTIQYIFSYYENGKDKSEIDKARQAAEDALKRVKAGEEFGAVAKDVSRSPSGNQGEPVTYEPGSLNPVLEDAVRQLKDGEYTDVLAVDSGFTILRRLSHKEAKVRTLDESAQSIRGKLSQALRAKAWDEKYQQLINEYKPKLNNDLLKQNEIADDAPVFYLDGEIIPYGQVRSQVDPIRKLPEDKMNAQLTSIFKNQLLAHASRKAGFDQSEEYAQQREELLRDAISANLEVTRQKDASKLEQAEDSEARKYYDENAAYFVTERETAILAIRVEIKPSTSTQASLTNKGTAFKTAQALRQRILGGEDFESVMKEANGSWDGTMSLSPYGPRGRIIDMAVEQLKVGEISQPVEDKNVFYIIKVTEDVPPKPKPFEEVKEPILNYLRNMKAREKLDQQREIMLKQADFKIDEAGFEAALGTL